MSSFFLLFNKNISKIAKGFIEAVGIKVSTSKHATDNKKKTTNKTKKKSVDAIAKEVINGKWGNGDTRKKKLKAAGYDYAAVQKRVNELL